MTTMRVTMRQPWRSEDGLSIWLANTVQNPSVQYGAMLVQQGIAVDLDGVLVPTRDSLTPAEVLAVQALIAQGAGYEPTIGAAITQRITLNEGSDADHAEILLTFNAGPAGDVAIASERLANADARVDVVKTLLTGAAADGAVLSFSLPNGLQNLYVARAGEAAYTEAAGATVTAAQAVCARWDAGLQLRYCTVMIGGPYTGGGSNGRYRDIVVTAFVGN